MIRFVSFLFTLVLLAANTNAQCVIYKHEDGRVLTTCDFYSQGQRLSTTPSHTQKTYLGSPFLTFPVWQPGTVLLDRQGKLTTCELAYNLVTNEVLCRFAGDSAINVITPEVFTINGTEFVRQQNKLVGLNSRLYMTALCDGQTQLLASLTKPPGDYVSSANYQVNDTYETNATIRNNTRADLVISGTFATVINYYIRKGAAKPEHISLTKSSVLAALYEQSDKIEALLPAKNLTMEDVVKALTYYDSLMTASRVNKLPLSVDPVFTQTIHEKIKYPDYARTQGIYGRVYAGFDIDERGTAKNITILSPENAGFRFDVVVRNALEKLPVVDPVLRGKYVLPVAFTLSNAKETKQTQTPVNRLPDDRLEGRMLLEEFVVNAVTSQPVTARKEVWGYYK